MPRNYNLNDNTGGTNMVGRAYTPQAAPWDRDGDDVSVQRSLREDSREWRDRRDDRYARDDQRRYGQDRGPNRSERDQDAYYRQDLVPGYGDGRVGFQNADSEREDRHRAGHRKNWENREPDYRYQYNDYRRADDHEERRENQARYGEHREDKGYRRENDRDTWMSDSNRLDHGREEYDRDRYNDRERYYARNESDRDRGRWTRR